jgi:hypothetical protein
MTIGLLTSVPHRVATLARDISDLSALALALGVVGGCMLSGWREQLKARRAQVLRQPGRRR